MLNEEPPNGNWIPFSTHCFRPCPVFTAYLDNATQRFCRSFAAILLLLPKALPKPNVIKQIAMPSFDIVSKVDLQTLDNAVNVVKKEITNRFDFKGSHVEIDLDKK